MVRKFVLYATYCMLVLRYLRPAPARASKGFSNLNIEDQTVIYALQQRPLNDLLNL
jgi:hypothetical protein